MLLTLSTTHSPASDLGYLLGKHPQRVQTFNLNFGQAHVFYPEVSAERCTAALLLDINPVGLVRRDGGGFELEQYVNDRPYVASSFFSVAIAEVYRSALAGICKERSELAQTPIPITAKIAVLPCRGGESLLRQLFEPLGYTLTVERHGLDEAFPEWGESRYFTVSLTHTTRLQDLLAHLYVLIPVLDDDKHYWVGVEEIDKLLRHGERWLANHPARDLITQRYLRHQKRLKHLALARLAENVTTAEEEEIAQEDAEPMQTAESEVASSASATGHDRGEISLHSQRLQAVLDVLKECGARRVLDLGCGEGRLLALLLKDHAFSEILGADVSHQALAMAADRLHLDRLPPKQRQRINLLQSSLTYRDQRLAGYDAAALVEVIEHLDPPRLAALERSLFEFARPKTVVITTPNAEYNVKWPSLAAGHFRHRDHRFEWARSEFEMWATGVSQCFGYTVRFLPIGPVDSEVGAPSQMGVFQVS